MKAEFELNLNKNGRPVISFRHHDKDGSLEQQVLKVFVDMAAENGLRMKQVSGTSGTGVSYNEYEISADETI